MEMALRNGAKPEKIEGHVQKSLSAARQAIQSLDETVWAMNPGNDTLPHLVNYIGEYAVEFLDNAGIRCRADLPEHLPSQPVSADMRHNLFLAIKESLNNVVRHASASEVQLRASVNNGSLTFSVVDNGHGFSAGQNKISADGLRNMRQRMEEIGGTFEMESTEAGTKISFICPWRDDED
jgi:signal transduction histidine kinase